MIKPPSFAEWHLSKHKPAIVRQGDHFDTILRRWMEEMQDYIYETVVLPVAEMKAKQEGDGK